MPSTIRSRITCLPKSRSAPRVAGLTIPHHVALKVIWFVLVSGCRWEDVPPGNGLLRHEPPTAACVSGRTLGVWDRLHADLLRLLRQNEQLDPDLVIVDGVIVRAFGGGEDTGPSPVDGAKKGSKHTLLVDRHGIPLAIHTAGANASDHNEIIPLVMDFPQVGGKVGRPKELPDELYADAGYDSDATRGCWPGWGSRRRSTSAGRRMAAAWAKCVGWWSGRSAGSKACGECGSATTASR